MWANDFYILWFIVQDKLVTESFTLEKLIKPRMVFGFVQY